MICGKVAPRSARSNWLDEIAKSYLSSAGAPYNYKNMAFDALYKKASMATKWKERKDRMFDLESFIAIM